MPPTQTDSETSHSITEQAIYRDLPAAQTWVLLISIAIVALCGIVYELIIGTVSSYLMGNSVYQFSLTIGFFMFSMGIGSYLSKFIANRLVQNFIYVEMTLAVVGGICSISLFLTFPFTATLYTAVMFAFILTIGTLVGLEIPLLTRILSAAAGTRKSIANVMSLDYIGALIGSVAFPLLLLPSLGLVASSFAIGLINIFIAFLNIVWLRNHLKNPRRLIILTGAIFILLAGLTLMGSRLTAFAQHHLYFDEIIWQKHTPYQNLVVTRDIPLRDLRLFIDGNLQFSQRDEYRYHESLVHPLMNWTSVPVEQVLVLGGGDGLAVRELLKYPNIKNIDLVDIDPAMTNLGKHFAPLVKINKGSLSDPKVHIHNQDAFVYINKTSVRYDRIILDFPDPHNEAISKLYSVEFFSMLSHHMSDDAALITQSSSPFFSRRTFWSIKETLAAVFPETSSFHVTIPSFGDWGFHIASTKKGGGLIGLPSDLKFLSQERFAAAQVFGRDVEQVGNPIINSIFEPKLYQIYLDDLLNGPLATKQYQTN
ncbi:MAG: polyamine aminopropyltransferase [Candidatus Thiodiazotropha sp.]|jgi:spermidine synthase